MQTRYETIFSVTILETWSTNVSHKPCKMFERNQVYVGFDLIKSFQVELLYFDALSSVFKWKFFVILKRMLYVMFAHQASIQFAHLFPVHSVL